MTQTEALAILKMGKNAFVTGPAGSGKTYVINQYIKYLKEHNVPIGITASTGIAATHMGGITIHSWAGIGIHDSLTEHDIEQIADKKHIRDKIGAAQVLIIDEVSMLHHFRLDMVDRVLQRMKKSHEPFGGMQVVLCGDFFQLPPISRLGEERGHFIYRSDSWKSGNFKVCYLGQNYRQADDPALGILNDIRSGEVSEQSFELLMSRKKGEEETDGDENSAENLSTRLYTHNVDVDSINTGELGKMDGVEVTYEMTKKGKKPLVEALKKSCLAPENLKLKKGARVMCVKNNFDEGYVNGTLGVIVSCGFGVDPVIHTAPTPDHPDGRRVTIERASWSIEEDGKVIAEISQYPLRLAWAITVHKSQGMSLDAVEVDLSKSFEPGMGYVALSRVRTLAGLKLLGINQNALQVNREVLEYDIHLRELSAKAESVIQHTDEKDIERVQKEFLAKVAPLHKVVTGGAKKPPVYKFPKPKAKPKKRSGWGRKASY